LIHPLQHTVVALNVGKFENYVVLSYSTFACKLDHVAVSVGTWRAAGSTAVTARPTGPDRVGSVGKRVKVTASGLALVPPTVIVSSNAVHPVVVENFGVVRRGRINFKNMLIEAVLGDDAAWSRVAESELKPPCVVSSELGLHVEGPRVSPTRWCGAVNARSEAVSGTNISTQPVTFVQFPLHATNPTTDTSVQVGSVSFTRVEGGVAGDCNAHPVSPTYAGNPFLSILARKRLG
jgi:hypothetical protein